jgi:hypothetical protein
MFNPELEGVRVVFKADFKQDNLSFIIIQGTVEFALSKDTWKHFYKEEEDSITLPKNFAVHLAGIAISTVRGILHAKTENSPFNKYYIKEILVKDIIKEDVSTIFKEENVYKEE